MGGQQAVAWQIRTVSLLTIHRFTSCQMLLFLTS